MMWRVALAAFLTLCLAALGLNAPSRAQFNGCQAGFCAPRAAGGGGYIGPGDLTLTGTVVAWGGFRAYSAAKAGTKAVRLINETTTTQQDINSLASGAFDAATAATLCGAAVCKVVTIYDQTGTNCSGGIACDVSEGTDASRPTYNASGGAGGNPCAVFASTNTLISAALTSSIAQPYTLSTVSSRTGNLAAFNGVAIIQSSLVGLYYSNSNNNFALFGGTSFTANVTASDNTFHAIAGVINGASSIAGIDGSSTSGLSTGSAATGTNNISIGDTSNPFAGTVCEFGIWNAAWTTGNISTMSTNQHGTNGYNF
jgi:hypothetical protein